MLNYLLTQGGGGLSSLFGSSSGIVMTVIYVVAFIAIIYF